MKAVLLKGNAAFRGFFIWDYGSAVSTDRGASLAADTSQYQLLAIEAQITAQRDVL